MVVKIYHGTDAYAYKNIDNTFFIAKSYGGKKAIQFDIPIKHPLYPYLNEETRLEYDDQYYLVIGVSERTSAGICTINAELDLTGLENKVYISKTWNTVPFTDFTSDILSGTGWRIVNADLIGKRTTTEAKDNTPLELLEKSTNTTSYGACYEYDTKNHLIICIKPENNTTPTGCYFTDELNLSELTMKGSSTGLITRLYPIGKDGLTIASVNNGIPYLENHNYSNKVKCIVWRDERYTNAQSLKEDGMVKLDAMASPNRSYTCKVIDLAKTNPEIYGKTLSFKLYDVITLIDRIRKSRLNHRIVEVKEYPADHSLDTVTLSSVAARVTGKLTELDNRLTELNAQQLHDRTKVNEIKQDIDTTVLRVSESWAESENASVITQTAEGLYLDVSKLIGSDQWSTKLQMSSEDIRVAWNTCSNFIKLENAKMNIYNHSNQKIISYGSDGQWLYADNKALGRIGAVNYNYNSSLPGLQLYVNHEEAAYIGWGSGYLNDAGVQVYNYPWLYAIKKFQFYEANTLNAGCDVDLHYHNLNCAKLDDWSFT